METVETHQGREDNHSGGEKKTGSKQPTDTQGSNFKVKRQIRVQRATRGQIVTVLLILKMLT